MSLLAFVFSNALVVMSFLTCVLLGFVESTVAFQTIGDRYVSSRRNVEGTWNDDRRYETKLAAVKDGGMDAFTAQLQAAHAEAVNANLDISSGSTTLEDAYATEMINKSRSAVTATTAAAGESLQSSTPRPERTGKHAISSLLMQRAIQTQLYYLADLRDEPTYMWMREFLNHGHLDDKGRFNELDGLRCDGGWQYYLEQLESAPSFSITVQLAPPRLSAQQKRNPYLAAQAVGRSYEETIMPSKISQTLRTVARSLETEWVPVLIKIAEEDRKRVQLYDAPPQIQTAAAAYQAFWCERQVVAGGEGDDQGTPLHALNERIGEFLAHSALVFWCSFIVKCTSCTNPIRCPPPIVARFCTRVALDKLIKELQGDSSFGHSAEDEEARRAAVEWLQDFANEWEPKLKRGPDDDKRRSFGVAPPGHWQRLCNGADANDVTEAMWQELPPLFAYASDDAMRLYSPEALAARLRRVRAGVCDELIGDLRATVHSMS